MTRALSILISTHNRAELLRRALRYVNAARRPGGWELEVVVVANACSDGTHALLEGYARMKDDGANPHVVLPLPLRWIAEPVAGKSHALNRAIPLLTSDLVAFVDDDHRVDPSYIEQACSAALAYPEADIFCGRILPDWDGSEPTWVHDDGPYRIYPLPVPRYDLGDSPLATEDVPIPGGGNLVVRGKLFARVGGFSAAYGPVGDSLGGAEDRDWVLRALTAGARIQYVPEIVQYHFADPARLTLSYLIRKAYERSASIVRLSASTAEHAILPPYMVRKVAKHLVLALTATEQRKRRFHAVRLAASLGEVKGHVQARGDRRGLRGIREHARTDRSARSTNA